MNTQVALFSLTLSILFFATAAPGGSDQEPHPLIAGRELAWQTDFSKALAEAHRSQKPILLNFTGSDWCAWCHRLWDEIFQTPAFSAYAAKELVLVELDFPRKKPLPDTLKKQNHALAEKYRVTGYPTVVFLSHTGTELGRLAYMQGGPKTFIRELRRLAGGHSSQPRP
ncbi:MAG: thioredoxin family protein [Candidatus Didemnitutus sp.]|nr:thioredoxin family protein [Candidatus Didemnitutus sp.]